MEEKEQEIGYREYLVSEKSMRNIFDEY